MPSKTTRKIIELGNSGVVSLPKEYRDYHNLKPGDIVIVLWDGFVLLIPKELENRITEKKELIDELLR